MCDASRTPSIGPDPESSVKRKRLRLERAMGLVVTCAVIAVLALFFRPQMLGGPISNIAVSGDSMLPTYRSGDFLVLKKQDSYAVGDVVVYVIPADDVGGGQRVVHRIVGGDENGFEMRGDNNSYHDPWNPTEDQILGQVWIRIPTLAALLSHLRDPLVLAITIGFVALAALAFPSSLRRNPRRWIKE